MYMCWSIGNQLLENIQLHDIILISLYDNHHLIFLVFICVLASPVEERTVVKSVFYMQYLSVYASDRGGSD